ncbi:MAG TPA: hypothetical protein VGG41_12335, partial [Solirubrobacteraceae bacterium]
FNYEWERCDSDSCTDIASADQSSSTYQTTGDDVGDTIEVVITGSNGTSGGSGPVTVGPSPTVTGPPEYASGASLSGDAPVDSTMTANPGTWTGSPAPTFKYEWERCTSGSCTDIASADQSSSTYETTSDDVGHTIEAVITGSNGQSGGSGSVTVGPSVTVTGPPEYGSGASLSGDAPVGSVLTATAGTWTGSPAPTFSYQWKRCNSGSCSDIDSGPVTSGDTSSSTYQTTGDDVGDTIEVVITASNGQGAGSGTQTVGPSVTVTGPPEYSSGASLNGDALVGSTLTASAGTWTGSPAPTFSYQWKRCNSGSCSDIDSGPVTSADTSSSSYKTTNDDVGDTIEVVITATNGEGDGSGPRTVGPSATVTAPPANTAAPTITGTATVGQTLMASTGTWSGYPVPSGDDDFTYQWQDCATATPAADSTACPDIGGAQSSSYVLGESDAGSFVRVVVTADNGIGTPAKSSSSPSGQVDGPAVNTSPPAITGTAQVGDALSVSSTGTWTGPPVPTSNQFTYQWQDCATATPAADPTACPDINGAQSSSYVVGVGDEGMFVRVVVTANNGIGAPSSASSGPSTQVQGPAANTSAPSITGTALVGDALSVSSNGTWSGFPAPSANDFTYQWQDCATATPAADPTACPDIGGAQSSSYVLGESDAGSFVRVVVTADNGIGTPGKASSSPGSQVQGPAVNTAPPTISGTPAVSDTLTASPGTWVGPPTPSGGDFTYQWQDCATATPAADPTACPNISGAQSSTYVPTENDAGFYARVIVTADNGIGSSSSATSTPTAQIDGAPQSNSPPSISGSALVGQTLTASPGSWSGPPQPTGSDFSYSWSDCDPAATCSVVQSGASNTYTLTPADAGDTVTVTVSATTTSGTSQSQPSSPTAVVESAPRNTVSPTIGGTVEVGQTLTASPGTWVGPPTPSPSTFTYEWTRCQSDGTACLPLGDSSPQYVPVGTDVGFTLAVEVSATNDHGTTTAGSGPTAPVSAAPPKNDTAPTITGTAQQGQKLTANVGTWENAPTSFIFQWERCDGASCADVGGGGNSYVAAPGDVGSTLLVTVTAHNSAGDTPAASAPSATVLVAAPAGGGLPQISGTPAQGETLSTAPLAWQPTPSSVTYQWYQCDPSGAGCTQIQNANAATYTPAPGDVGHTLRVQVTAQGAGGTTVVTSGPSAVIGVFGASVPPPILQQSADLSPVSGTVLIKLPGSNTFVPLTNPLDVPDGAIIDATQGTVSLTTQLPDGTYQTGQFYSGEFSVSQNKHGTVNAKLAGGSFAACKGKSKKGKTKHGKPKRGAEAAGAAKKPNTVVRQLWGNAHGNYTTKGRYGSASVSGTIWLTQDRCNGTFFKALKDDVYVVAFSHPHKRHHLMQGQTILIPAP